MSFYNWLISLSIMSWRFLHVVTCVRITFLFNLNNIPLMLGMIEGRRRRGRQKMRDWMASPTHGLMDMDLSKLRELVMDKEAWSALVHGVTKSQTRLSNWTAEYSIMCTYHILFIHSLISGYLSCLQFLVTVNNMAMIGVYSSFEYIPRSGISG